MMAVQFIPMAYEVDANTLDAYNQHLLSQRVDEKEERFKTYKEKDLYLHKKFTRPKRKRKVRKWVKKLVGKMGLSKEAMQNDREKNVQKKEDMVKLKTKPVSSPPKHAKPRKSKSTPISSMQKPVPPPKLRTKSISGT